MLLVVDIDGILCHVGKLAVGDLRVGGRRHNERPPCQWDGKGRWENEVSKQLEGQFNLCDCFHQGGFTCFTASVM